MNLVLMRCAHAYVDHGQQGEYVGLQERNKNVQSHEEYGNHHIAQADEYVDQLLAAIHVAVETNGEREHAGSVADDIDWDHQPGQPPDRSHEMRRVLQRTPVAHSHDVVVKPRGHG